MRFLKGYSTGIGALLTVAGIILYTTAPGRGAVCLTVGGIGLLLMAAGLVLNRGRLIAFLKGKRGRAAGASAGYALSVVAVLVLVNFLAGRHSGRLDLTENKAFSLSEQTVKVIESLPREVAITAFYRELEPTRQKLEDLLAEYKYHSARLGVKYVDPDKSPGEVKRYGITEYGTIVVESGKQESRVNTADEEAITNAIIKVTKDRERVVYVTTGHGERSLTDKERNGMSLLDLGLDKQHYTRKTLVLNQGVPADAGVVLIAGPQKPFLGAEKKMIADYLDRGGRLLLMEDPDGDPGLGDVLAPYGVEVRKDIIIDRVSQIFGQDPRVPMVPPDGYDETHPITKNFHLQTFFPLASSIEVKEKLPEGVTVTNLAQTSSMSWGEKNSETELRTGRVRLDKGVDTPGPLTLGVAIARKQGAAAKPASDTEKEPAPKTETRILLFGDSDFLNNTYFNASGNGDLGLSCIAWLAEREDLISIRPKSTTPRVVILSPQEVFYYFWTIVALAPMAITVVGVGIWWRRRKL
jgi:ABC-type uncharacterized transport system involved in gliding motility auxiliary subunit